MSKNSIRAILNNPYNLIFSLGNHNFLHWIPDELYLKLLWKAKFDTPLNLKNPQTFNEKLQWLKLYNRKPEYTQMVDKYEVRDYIKEKIGEEYLIPLLGVWDKAENIDFASLPNQFVLKCNHDSGSVIICKDKSKFDKNKATKKLNTRLKIGTYWPLREWPYKNVPRKIIAEQYMEDADGRLTDYKFFCFNGKVDCVMLCLDRQSGDTKFYFFDREWNLKRYNKRGLAAPKEFTLPKPKGMDEMFALAEKLAKYCDSPFVRIDLYDVDGKIYFGEYTFFPDSGFDNNLLKKTDDYFGNLIELEK